MTTHIGWPSAIRLHADAMRAADRAEGTIETYSGHLDHFSRGDFMGPWEVTQHDLELYIGQRTSGTKGVARSALRSFYRWAHGHGYIDHNPAAGLPSLRAPQGRRRWPAPELVVSQVLDDPRVEPRVRFMAELAALAGLRVCEIAKVRGTDLGEDNRLRVVGKGGKVRMVPITDEVLLERLRAVGDAWAFPNRSGGHLLPRYVTMTISKALPGKWTAHTLRHRFATRSNEEHQDLLALSEVLGHASVSTTQVYVLVSDERTRQVAAAAGRPRREESA